MLVRGARTVGRRLRPADRAGMLPGWPVARGRFGVYSGRVNPRSKKSDPKGKDERLVGFTSFPAQRGACQMQRPDRYMTEEERRAEAMARDPVQREAAAILRMRNAR